MTDRDLPDNILNAAFHLDNKPHKLFEHISRAAGYKRVDAPEYYDEIIRLAHRAYLNASP